MPLRSKFGGVWLSVVALGIVCLMTAAAAQAQSAEASSSSKKNVQAKTTSHKRHKSTGKTSASSKRSTTTRGSASARVTSTSGKRSSRKKKPRGQQAIDSERARSIQEALIREHYLNGEPSGSWNQESEQAMRRYQADHGWQSKTVPDSRALISLGLGPSKDHLLNPESAMTTGPESPRAESLPATSQSPAPVSSSPMPNPTDGETNRPQ